MERTGSRTGNDQMKGITKTCEASEWMKMAIGFNNVKVAAASNSSIELSK